MAVIPVKTGIQNPEKEIQKQEELDSCFRRNDDPQRTRCFFSKN